MDRDDLKRQVQEATDIIQLIGEQVTLRPKGKEFACLCPFHEDRNPSMFVSPQKQIYKCFVCGAGGDVFSFVMNYHKLSFPEAMKVLAERAGIELPDTRSPQDTAKASLPHATRRLLRRRARRRSALLVGGSRPLRCARG